MMSGFPNDSVEIIIIISSYSYFPGRVSITLGCPSHTMLRTFIMLLTNFIIVYDRTPFMTHNIVRSVLIRHTYDVMLCKDTS